MLNRYANLKDPANLSSENILLYYLTWFGKTRNDYDFLVLVHESANSLKQSRNIWVAPPGIPKMIRIPPVGYDQPFPGSESIMFIDMVDMYNGAFDRYVWKLTGKHEMFLPYNSYRISDGRYKYDQLLTPKHFNQVATRYELHRVWVLEATVKKGYRHVYAKRRFYLDEDSWHAVWVDNYDARGQLWRASMVNYFWSPAIQGFQAGIALYHDLNADVYFADRMVNESKMGWRLNVGDLTADMFAPDAAQRSGH